MIKNVHYFIVIYVKNKQRKENMNEVEVNKEAWGLLSKDHYEHYKKELLENKHFFSSIIENELGDISGNR